MNRRITIACIATLLAAAWLSIAAEGAKRLYFNNFQDAALGQKPADMVIVNGTFVVKSDAAHPDNKVLELSPDPLEGDGLLFGPNDQAEIAVSARIFATATGKRCPELGVGLCDAAGYRLWLMPAVNELQLIKGDEVLARTAFAWQSGTWTKFKFQIRKIDGGQWQVEGKAWRQGEPEPPTWMLSAKESSAPQPGRASAWGTPFSSTPILFDDLEVTAAE